MMDDASVMIRHEFWFQWGRIAQLHALQAKKSRARIGTTGDSADDSVALSDELDAGVLSICAAAFSIESMLRLLGPLVVPAAVSKAWDRKKTGYETRLRETLKLLTTLAPADVDNLVDPFSAVIVARGNAVHYSGEFEQPVPTPISGQGSSVTVMYSAERAEAAVEAMRSIYVALLDYPRPQVREFVRQQAIGLARMAGRYATP